MANLFNKVSLTIIRSELRSTKLPQHLHSFNLIRKMVIGLFYIKPSSLHPSPYYDAYVTRGTPTIVQRNPAISLLISKNRFGGTTFPDFPRYCQTLQGIHHNSYYDAYLVLLTPNLSLVYIGTPIPNPSYHAAPV